MNVTSVVTTTRPERTERLWELYVRIYPVLLAEEQSQSPESKRFSTASQRAWAAATLAVSEFYWNVRDIAAFEQEVS